MYVEIEFSSTFHKKQGSRLHDFWYAPSNLEQSHQQVQSIDELVTSECAAFLLYPDSLVTIVAAWRRLISQFKGEVLYTIDYFAEPFVLNISWKDEAHHFDYPSLK